MVGFGTIIFEVLGARIVKVSLEPQAGTVLGIVNDDDTATNSRSAAIVKISLL